MRRSGQFKNPYLEQVEEYRKLNGHFRRLWSVKSVVDNKTPRSVYLHPKSKLRNITRRSKSTESLALKKRHTAENGLRGQRPESATSLASLQRLSSADANSFSPRVWSYGRQFLDGDVIQRDFYQFAQPLKPFQPRTLLTNFTDSKVAKSRNYQPPRNFRGRRKELQNGTVVETLQVPAGANLNQTQSTWDSGQLRPSSVQALRPKTQIVRISPSPQYMTPSRPLKPLPVELSAKKVDEAQYMQFLQDVTNDMVECGYYSDQVLKNIIQVHMGKREKLLDEDRMKSLVSRLLDDLGVLKSGVFEEFAEVEKSEFKSYQPEVKRKPILQKTELAETGVQVNSQSLEESSKSDSEGESEEKESLNDADIKDLLNGKNLDAIAGKLNRPKLRRKSSSSESAESNKSSSSAPSSTSSRSSSSKEGKNASKSSRSSSESQKDLDETVQTASSRHSEVDLESVESLEPSKADSLKEEVSSKPVSSSEEALQDSEEALGHEDLKEPKQRPQTPEDTAVKAFSSDEIEEEEELKLDAYPPQVLSEESDLEMEKGPAEPEEAPSRSLSLKSLEDEEEQEEESLADKIRKQRAAFLDKVDQSRLDTQGGKKSKEEPESPSTVDLDRKFSFTHPLDEEKMAKLQKQLTMDGMDMESSWNETKLKAELNPEETEEVDLEARDLSPIEELSETPFNLSRMSRKSSETEDFDVPEDTNLRGSYAGGRKLSDIPKDKEERSQSDESRSQTILEEEELDQEFQRQLEIETEAELQEKDKEEEGLSEKQKAIGRVVSKLVIELSSSDESDVCT